MKIKWKEGNCWVEGEKERGRIEGVEGKGWKKRFPQRLNLIRCLQLELRITWILTLSLKRQLGK